MNTNTSLPTFEQKTPEISEILEEHATRIKRIEFDLRSSDARILALGDCVDRRMDSESRYVSAQDFCKRQDLEFNSLKAVHALDSLATTMCRNLDIRVGNEPNAMWGWITLFPIEVLWECMMTILLLHRT
ncbi:MAG: hypothetical protein HQL77_18820 [Magnetococcales bacterium]|nr:hypothetical protein [Magnetococcales bacterium]